MPDNEFTEAAEKMYEKYRYTADWVSFYLGFLEGHKKATHDAQEQVLKELYDD